MSKFQHDLRLLLFILLIHILQLGNHLQFFNRKLLIALVVNQQQLVDIVIDDLHDPVPQPAQPLHINHKLTAGHTVVFVFDKNLQKLHEHRNRVHNVVDLLVLLQTIINLNKVGHLQNVDLLHHTVLLLLWVCLVQLCVRCYEVNATRKLVNRSPASHSNCNLFFRKDLTDILNLAHTMKVNETQPIHNHFKLFSIQVVNDLLHHFVLGHQNKDVVQRDLRFFKVWGRQILF